MTAVLGQVPIDLLFGYLVESADLANSVVFSAAALALSITAWLV